MATKAPKSILKKPSTPGALAADQAAAAKAREVAVTHAKIIHQQRDHEDRIGDSIIELSKLPLVRDSSCSASNPAQSDADAFRSGIRLFQPGDYDDLIEERNAEGRCGYTLCPKPRRRFAGGEWKIVGSSILPKKEVEKWCSQACAKRALYVKVQLNETAAWERAGIESIQIELYEDPDQKLAQDMSNLQLEKEREAVKISRDLALERGDINRETQQAVPIDVKEKTTVKAAEEPTLENHPGNDGHLILEGYKVKSREREPTPMDTEST
ncbi:Rtr1/RPAP2 family-domain-containing protein [Pestalotiopsis sp. NC0098]|nr:Rtr1/RPAP2 family-domain-containing protein [Pestalotiopsis sp. NC0098]